MKYALFSGCRTGFDVPQHPKSAKAILSRLNVELEELDFGCCGYPVKETNLDASLLLSARNLAMAQARNLPVLALCTCCFGNLKQAEYYLKNNPDKKGMINQILKKEGLVYYDGGVKIHHTLTFLDREIKKDDIRQSITNPLKGVKVAASYGCHGLRPSNITGFDDQPNAPTIFERIIALTGAEPITWPKRLECCGHPQKDKNNNLSQRMILQKYETAKQEGADIICVACNCCRLQFEYGRGLMKPGAALPVTFLTQLLGRAMGFDNNRIGLETAARNR